MGIQDQLGAILDRFLLYSGTRQSRERLELLIRDIQTIAEPTFAGAKQHPFYKEATSLYPGLQDILEKEYALAIAYLRLGINLTCAEPFFIHPNGLLYWTKGFSKIEKIIKINQNPLEAEQIFKEL